MSLFLAFVRRDLLIESSYRVSMLFGVFSSLVHLLSTWFLGVAIGPGAAALQSWGGDYFAFAVIGIAIATPLHSAQYGFARHIRNAQVEGTLEPILVTPLPLARALMYQSAFGIAAGCARSLLFLLAAVVLFGVPLHASGIPTAMLAFGLGLLAHAAIGLLSAAFTLALKRGDPVSWIIETLSVLLGGVLFPVEVLPAPLRWLAGALPITHALDLARRSLLLGTPLSSLLGPMAILFGFVLVLGAAAGFTFDRALRRARDDGSLTHF